METKRLIPRGSEWRKWDLQVHTYLDASWRWPADYPNGSDKQEERIARFNSDFIQHCIKNEIVVIGITDHNIGEAIDGLQIKNSELGNKLTILPGVEVISTEGIHILAIFNPDPIIKRNRWATWKETIDNFLTAIYTGNPRFESEGSRNTPANSPLSIEDIIYKAKEYSAVAIFPHVLSSGTGIFNCNSRTRKRVLNLCNILDLACDVDEIDSKTRAVNGKLEGHQFDPNKYALIRTSDSRKIADIGYKFTWIKANPDFDGLRQIIYEPKARICNKEKAPLYLYPQIVSARLLNNKNYQKTKYKDIFLPITLETKVFFSPNLTTIIGPRAVGKTALVELIGYNVNKFTIEKKDKKLPLIEFLSKEFPELEVEISYQSGEEQINTLIRKVSDFSDPFYSSPLKVEYWTQGEIEKKADSPKQIADYIGDRLQSNNLIITGREISELYDEMESIRREYMRKLEKEIEKGKLEAERKQIETYFEKLKSKEYKEIVSNIKNNREKRQLLEGVIQDIENHISLINKLARQVSLAHTVNKKELIELFRDDLEISSDIERFYKVGESWLYDVNEKLNKIVEKIKRSKVKTGLDEEDVKLKKNFSNYCKENGIIVTQDEYQKRNERIRSINQQLSKVDNLLKGYDQNNKRHAQLAIQLKMKLDKWVSENRRLIDGFNISFEGTEIAAVWRDPKHDIVEWLATQFIKSNEELKEIIERNYRVKSPIRKDYVEELIKELVNKPENDAIAEIRALISQAKAPKHQESVGKKETLNWYFIDNRTQVIRDDLLMRLNEYAETGDNFIKYGNKILGKDSMSFGERCGTLVELILLSGDHPLIVDQPEDHLDAKFVAVKVVNLIRDQKIKRQIVICTHNANIVVLGDSELITSLSVDDNKVKATQGPLEDNRIRNIIYDVLEGGETAFIKREQKYGFEKVLESFR